MTKPSITSGQKERIAQLVIDKLIALGADSKSAQRIITRGGDLQAVLIDPLLDFGAMRYKDEEQDSTRGYPQIYAVKPVCEQLLILKDVFPGLSTSAALTCSREIKAPTEGPEGSFAIPLWQKVAKTYGEAVQAVFRKIAAGRNFHNYREGQLGEKYLRESERSIAMFANLANAQKSDIVITPAQFGLFHARPCQSVRRVREVYLPNEFGLGAFAVGCMLLTHPERLQSNGDLFVDCPGDEFAPDTDGRFFGAPIFGFLDDGVKFSTDLVGDACGGCGSASGFLSQ